MQPNWQQQQQQQYPYGQSLQQGGQPGMGGVGNPSFLQNQATGYPGPGGGGVGMQPMQTGFNMSQRHPPSSSHLSFLNQPPPSSFRTGGGGMGGGLNPQMTGYVAGGASGLMSQQTGYPGGGGMMSQPTGMMSQPTGFGGGGLMAQQTGMPGGGLRAQPTGFQDPRLQSMMQSFMPSNMSQASVSSHAPLSLSLFFLFLSTPS